MAAPTVRAVGANAGGTTTATPGLPTGTADRDLLICIAESGASTTEPTMDAAWTKIRTVKTGTVLATDAMLTVWYTWGTSTTVSRVISSTTDHVSSRIIGITAETFYSESPLHSESGGNIQTSATTGVTISGLTTTVNDCLIVSISAASLPDSNSTVQYSAWANSSTGTLTERTDNNINTGNGGGHGSATSTMTSAGTVSGTTATKATAALLANLMIAINPILPRASFIFLDD